MEKICEQIFAMELRHRGSKWANALPVFPAAFPLLSLKNNSIFLWKMLAPGGQDLCDDLLRV